MFHLKNGTIFQGMHRMRFKLLIVTLVATLSEAHWPICYDYAVKDGCYKRNPDSGKETPKDGLSTSNCYYSEPWTEESTFPWVSQGNGAREGTSNTGGHEEDLTLTLPLCSTELKRRWAEQTLAVNKACDYKTLLGVKHCGNCWVQMCSFHNLLHWNKEARFCTQQLFSYRMLCYSTWYERYCGEAGAEQAVADGQQPFLFPDKVGVYEKCSSRARRTAAPTSSATLVLITLLISCLHLLLPIVA